MGTAVYIENVPHGFEPATLYRHFEDLSRAKDITEIIGRHGGSRSAYIVFRTAASALAFIEEMNGKKQDFGVHGQFLYVSVGIADGDIECKYGIRLTDFLREREEDSKVRSRTIEMRGLPDKGIETNINEIFDSRMERAIENDDGTLRDENALVEWESMDAGCALVRFETTGMAREALAWNGTYWKNHTIYVKCVPDEEMDGILEYRAQKAAHKISAGKDVKVFVKNLRYGFDENYIHNVFHPHQLKNVNIPRGDKVGYALAFMDRDVATAFFKQYPKGRMFDGRYLNMVPDTKGGFRIPNQSAIGTPSSITSAGYTKEVATVTSSVPAPAKKTIAATPTRPLAANDPEYANDIKITNLEYSVGKLDVRAIFKADLESLIKKVVINKDGTCYVRFGSKDAARKGVTKANGKKIRGRVIRATMVQP